MMLAVGFVNVLIAEMFSFIPSWFKGFFFFFLKHTDLQYCANFRYKQSDCKYILHYKLLQDTEYNFRYTVNPCYLSVLHIELCIHLFYIP